MTLSFEQIKEITHGIQRIEQLDDGIHFYRFSEKEQSVYDGHDFFGKTFATAGVKLEFKTNSTRFGIKTEVIKAATRNFFSIDVFVDGKYLDCLRNSPAEELLGTLYSLNEYDWKNTVFEKVFDLGDGEKKVTVYFPWSFALALKEITLDDGSYVTEVKQEKKMLVVGDSITHGYDALYTSNRYATIVTSKLGVCEYNKAIGGEIFNPRLAQSFEKMDYDYVSVAYGTNDWSSLAPDKARENCEGFFEALCTKFDKSKIFVISPIWRNSYLSNEKPFGSFFDMEKMIFEVAGKYKNTVCISGIDMIDKDISYLADLSVHPNDNGFKQYGERLYNEIKKYID